MLPLHPIAGRLTLVRGVAGLAYNQLTDAGANLSQPLAEVVSLDLSHNNLTDLAATLKHLGVRGPASWTITRHDGPNHLGLWYNALPEHQMALITSGCAPVQTKPKLRQLYLCGNPFALRRQYRMCVLAELPKLTMLDDQAVTWEELEAAELMKAQAPIAIGETVILLHPPLPLIGVSIWMERGCQ